MNRRRNRAYGFTLVEMLMSLALLGVLMLAFTQMFGRSLRAAGQVSGRSELVSEGQIAQQLIAARLQNAVFVYPAPTALQLTASDVATRNTVGPSSNQNWVVGTDPILAMVLPPVSVTDAGGNAVACGAASAAARDACFTFYAYYPYRRGSLISSALAAQNKPPANPNNDNQWLLMEYKSPIYDNVTRSAPTLYPPTTWTYASILSGASPINMRGGSGMILTDYVQPSTSAPTYAMFTVDTVSALNNATVSLRFLQMRGGRELRAPATVGSSPLSTRVYPRNWTCAATTNCPF